MCRCERISPPLRVSVRSGAASLPQSHAHRALIRPATAAHRAVLVAAPRRKERKMLSISLDPLNSVSLHSVLSSLKLRRSHFSPVFSASVSGIRGAMKRSRRCRSSSIQLGFRPCSAGSFFLFSHPHTEKWEGPGFAAVTSPAASSKPPRRLRNTACKSWQATRYRVRCYAPRTSGPHHTPPTQLDQSPPSHSAH